ncbi:hypothetical protein Acr_05g0001310 [Actinidia rufa]|uniref:Late embryogenesis abundant (LEA) hydroxyproline-rich glycoprotein family n=1 Tax=Actinidia rufa TaxID=165716 RepID=A0A7J0EJM4_9ERIC|nr:hypothetical protein Acr_05g0001310 [Actinidia rufa]
MSMHTKTDSEVTSLAASSPARSLAAEAAPCTTCSRRRATPTTARRPPTPSTPPPFSAPSAPPAAIPATPPPPPASPLSPPPPPPIAAAARATSSGRNSISFDTFSIQAGNDNSGVATEMMSPILSLNFILATGSIKKFYQSRKSQRTLTVMMQGTRIPLYGGGVDLSSKDGIPTAPVPLTLSFMVRSRAYVLGKLVKPKFYKRVQCSVVLDPKKMNVAMSLKNSCTYK